MLSLKAFSSSCSLLKTRLVMGDGPFRALPPTESCVAAQPQDSAASTTSFQTMNHQAAAVSNFDFVDTLPGITYNPPSVSTAQPPSATP